MSSKKWSELNEVERSIVLDLYAMFFEFREPGLGAKCKEFLSSFTERQLDLLRSLVPEESLAALGKQPTPILFSPVSAPDGLTADVMIAGLAESTKQMRNVSDADLGTLLKAVGIAIDPKSYRQRTVSLYEKFLGALRSLTPEETAAMEIGFKLQAKLSEAMQKMQGASSRPASKTEDSILAERRPDGEVELTATIEMMNARLAQLYNMRRGKLIKTGHQITRGVGRPVGDGVYEAVPEDVYAWCGSCGRNTVKPSAGEDTCGSCLRAV